MLGIKEIVSTFIKEELNKESILLENFNSSLINVETISLMPSIFLLLFQYNSIHAIT